MTLLYRVEDEIAIEMSRVSWDIVQQLVESCDWTTTLHTQIELSNFASAIRSHLQHIQAPDRSVKGGVGPVPTGGRLDAADNMDLA